MTLSRIKTDLDLCLAEYFKIFPHAMLLQRKIKYQFCIIQELVWEVRCFANMRVLHFQIVN